MFGPRQANRVALRKRSLPETHPRWFNSGRNHGGVIRRSARRLAVLRQGMSQRAAFPRRPTAGDLTGRRTVGVVAPACLGG